MTFLSEDQKQFVDEEDLVTAEVTGVADAYSKHEAGVTKGAKVHFAIDKSGVFHIEKSDIQFELQPEEVNVCNHSIKNIDNCG